MDILRITARWTGFTGAPGYSNFFFRTDGGFWDGGLFRDPAQEAADGAANDVTQAFAQLAPMLPSVVQITVEDEAVVIDSDTGEAIGFTEVDGGTVSGSGDSGGYSAASGAVVNWRTNDYRFGRRIRGRTFLVPLDGAAYEDDGTLEPDARERIGRFGDRISDGDGGGEFGVWSRPRGGTGGVFASVTAWNSPDRVAVLRSRRD